MLIVAYNQPDGEATNVQIFDGPGRVHTFNAALPVPTTTKHPYRVRLGYLAFGGRRGGGEGVVVAGADFAGPTDPAGDPFNGRSAVTKAGLLTPGLDLDLADIRSIVVEDGFADVAMNSGSSIELSALVLITSG